MSPLLFSARNKIRDNPENEVGIVSMADNFVRCSLTAETAKLNTIMSQIQPAETINLNTSIRVAQLALKHRINKHHKQRIVLFLCSPIERFELLFLFRFKKPGRSDEIIRFKNHSSEGIELIRTAKRLKKEKVNIDIISFGDYETEFNQVELCSPVEVQFNNDFCFSDTFGGYSSHA